MVDKQVVQVENQKQPNQKIPLSAWIFLVLVVIYTVSPVDIIPDAPIVGQIDDAAIDLTAVFNLIEKAVRIKYPSFGKFLKILKWTFFALAVLLILAILFFGFLITLQAHRNF